MVYQYQSDSKYLLGSEWFDIFKKIDQLQCPRGAGKEQQLSKMKIKYTVKL